MQTRYFVTEGHYLKYFKTRENYMNFIEFGETPLAIIDLRQTVGMMRTRSVEVRVRGALKYSPL